MPHKFGSLIGVREHAKAEAEGRVIEPTAGELFRRAKMAEDRAREKSIEDQVIESLDKPGGITEGDLLNIVNRTLPPNAQAVIQEKSLVKDSSQIITPLSRIYTELSDTQDIVITQEIITEGMFASAAGTRSGSDLYTSSLQSTASQEYFYQAVDGATTAALDLFTISYGDLTGSNPSIANYKYFRNLLLAANDNQFTFNSGSDIDKIIVFAFNRARFKERLDPGNWEMDLISGSTPDAALGFKTYVDNSGASTSTKTAIGDRYNILSGSIISGTVGSTVYGFSYPDLGLLVFDADALATGTILGYTSSLKFIEQGIDFMHARSEQKLKSLNYFIRIFNKEYNYSNNPSFFSASDGSFSFDNFATDPRTYITTIGLYNETNELLATARLNQPLQKSFEKEAIIRVRLSF